MARNHLTFIAQIASDTKVYPKKRIVMANTPDQEALRDYVKSTFKDPIFQLLSAQSLFTEIQLESLLIDYASADPAVERVPPEAKLLLRKISKGRTRGSYNRTLSQARRKLTRILSSLLLVGYVGLMDPTQVTELVETATELRELQEKTSEPEQQYGNSPRGNTEPEFMEQAKKELKNRLERLISQKERRTKQ